MWLCLSIAERVDQPTVAGCSKSINRGAKGPSDVCSQGRINRTWFVCFSVCVRVCAILSTIFFYCFSSCSCFLIVLFLLLFLLADLKLPCYSQ